MMEMTPEEREKQKAANRERSAAYRKQKKQNRTSEQIPSPLHCLTMQVQPDGDMIVPVHSSVPSLSHREHHSVPTACATMEVRQSEDVILPVIPVLPAFLAVPTATNTATLQQVALQPAVLQIPLSDEPNVTSRT